MKKNLIYFALILSTLIACNKQEANVKPNSVLYTPKAEITLTGTVVPNTVITIAGSPSSYGFVNGPAPRARFYHPEGIQIMRDGTLYIADENNNAIRKLTTDGYVSTLALRPPPSNPDGLRPKYVGIDNAGKIHIVQSNIYPGNVTYIYNPTGSVANYQAFDYTFQGPLAKDPYNDVFYFTDGLDILKHVPTSTGIGTGPLNYDKTLLTDDETAPGEYLHGLFLGKNNVVYFATTKRLFKYTAGGITKQLYPTLQLGAITCIILTADSQTMYLAMDGKIVKIFNGKLTVLAGPNAATPDGRDGVGLKADVNAFALALGDNEKTIYFSNTKNNTIRKLMLN
jgi:hypothetical protein